MQTLPSVDPDYMNNLHSWQRSHALRVHGFRHTQEGNQQDTRAGGRRSEGAVEGGGVFGSHIKSQAAEMKGKREYVKEVWEVEGVGGAVGLMEVSV